MQHPHDYTLLCIDRLADSCCCILVKKYCLCQRHALSRPRVKSGPELPFKKGKSLLEDSLTHPMPLQAGHVDQWPFKSFTSPMPRHVLQVLSHTWYTSWQLPSRGSHVSSLCNLVFPSGGNSPQGLNIEIGSALPMRRPLSLRGRDRLLLTLLTSAWIRCADASFLARGWPLALPTTFASTPESIEVEARYSTTPIARRYGATASGNGQVHSTECCEEKPSLGMVETGSHELTKEDQPDEVTSASGAQTANRWKVTRTAKIRIKCLISDSSKSMQRRNKSGSQSVGRNANRSNHHPKLWVQGLIRTQRSWKRQRRHQYAVGCCCPISLYEYEMDYATAYSKNLPLKQRCYLLSEAKCLR